MVEKIQEFASANHLDMSDPSTWPNQQASYYPSMPPTDSSSPYTLSGIQVDDYSVDEMELAPRAVRGMGKKVAMMKGGKKYTLKETLIVARCFVDVSKDAATGNCHRVRVFWKRIAERYDRLKPYKAFVRDWDHLCKHWTRVQADLSRSTLASSATSRKCAQAAMAPMAFASCPRRPSTKKEANSSSTRRCGSWCAPNPKFACGAASGGPKWAKNTSKGQYTSSCSAEGIDLNAVMEESYSDEDARPMGRNAKRKSTKGKEKVDSSKAPVMPPMSHNASAIQGLTEAILLKHYTRELVVDTCGWSEEKKHHHENALQMMHNKLGIN